MTSKKTRKPKAKTNQSLEQQLWSTADTLRKNIDASEYKYVVLGLIFLKYISSAFEAIDQSITESEAKNALDAFGEKWDHKYPQISCS